MKTFLTISALSMLAACSAPEINDWPPAAPKVSAHTVQRYVDIYASEEPEVPVYNTDDLMALNVLSRRDLRNEAPDADIERFRDDLRKVLEAQKAEPSQKKTRSRTEIIAIKKRIARKYESHHDQRHILKSRYGL